MAVSPFLKRGFQLLRDGKVDDLLSELGHIDDGGVAIRPFLPYLVRVAVFSGPASGELVDRRSAILAVVTGLESAQSILSSVSVDLEKLRHDISSEKQLRSKQAASGASSHESVLLQSIERSLEVEFDRADSNRKLRLFMCELLRLVWLVDSKRGDWFPISHPLLDSPLYAEDVVDFLHLALTELHPLVSCEEIVGVLLRLQNGSMLLVQLVAGLPHCYQSVLDAVVACTFRNGDEQSQAWKACSAAMLALCRLDSPLAALRTRELCMRSGGPPCCMLLLTDELAKSVQDQSNPFNAAAGAVWLDFITSLLMDDKCPAHNALVEYIKAAQKKVSRQNKAHPAFESLLDNIHQELISVFMASHPQAQLLGVMQSTSAADESMSEMVMDMGNGGQSAVEDDDSFVHEEVMDIGMPLVNQSSGHGDSLDDGFTEVEELQSGTAATAGMSNSSLQLNEGDEDLLKQIGAGVLGLDTSMVSLSESQMGLDLDVKGLLQLPESETVRACQLLRSFCALVGISNLRLSGEQTEPLVQLITARPPRTESGARFVEIALCTLLTCPSLTGDVEHTRSVVDWLQWLLKEQAAFDKALCTHVPYGELLLLVAIHYHGGELKRIAELVRMVLKMNITLPSSRLTCLKILFTQDVFTEKVVMEHAVQVGVTPRLSADMTNYLPIHCLLELMKTQSFARHASGLNQWIYRQLLECSAPIHSLLPDLIDKFVRILILPIQGVTPPLEGIHKGFSDSEILDVFSDPVESSKPGRNRTVAQATSVEFTASNMETDRHHHPVAGVGGDEVPQHQASGHGPVVQLLMLYYVLTYHDCLLTNLKKIMSIPTISRNANPVALSPFSLVSKLPVKKLLVCARQSPRQCGSLYSRLLRLLVTHLPHLCLTQDWLSEESDLLAAGPGELSLSASPSTSSPFVSPTLAKKKKTGEASGRNFRGWVTSTQRQVKLPSQVELSTAYDNISSNPSLCTSCMKRLSSLKDPSLLVPYLDVIVSALPKLLDPKTPRVLQTSTATLWRRLCSVVPRRLWVATVNALKHNGVANAPVVKSAAGLGYTEEDLINNPLLVLSCRRDVFRCPVVFELTCRVLAAYIAARTADITEKSHNTVMLSFRRNPQVSHVGVMEHESEELRSAMCAAEDSLAIQMLIETCLPTKEEIESNSTGQDLSVLTEIRGIVSSVLHQMYIDDPSIAKLVHFQGYDERLLPIFIASVPSMYICVDFIPELLTQPQQDRQVFALQLCFHLCTHYPLKRTLAVARSAISHLTSIISARAFSEYTPVFLRVLPALTRACHVLPALLDDTVPLLLRLGHILCSTGRENIQHLVSPPISPLKPLKEDTLAQAASLPNTPPYQQLLKALHMIFDVAA